MISKALIARILIMTILFLWIKCEDNIITNEKTNQNSWNIYKIYNIKMVNISREAHEKNGVEAIVDNYAIMRLKEKHIADG